MPFTEISSQETSQSLVLDTVQAYLADATTQVYVGNDLTVADNLTVLGTLSASGTVDIGDQHNISADDIVESSARRFLTTSAQNIAGTKTFSDQLNCDANVVVGNEYRNRANVFGVHVLSDQSVDEISYTGANVCLYMNTHEGSLTTEGVNDANQLDTGEATPTSAQFGEFGIGSVAFYGNDNSVFRQGARILVQPTSVWSSSDVNKNPCTMKFCVNDSSETDYTSETTPMVELQGFSRKINLNEDVVVSGNLTALSNVVVNGSISFGNDDNSPGILFQDALNRMVIGTTAGKALAFQQGDSTVFNIGDAGEVNFTTKINSYKTGINSALFKGEVNTEAGVRFGVATGTTSTIGHDATNNVEIVPGGAGVVINGDLNVTGTISGTQHTLASSADDINDADTTNRFLKRGAAGEIQIVRDGTTRLNVANDVTVIEGNLNVSGWVKSTQNDPHYLTIDVGQTEHTFPTVFYDTIILDVTAAGRKLILPLYSTVSAYYSYAGRVVKIINTSNIDVTLHVANTTANGSTDNGFIGGLTSQNNRLNLNSKRSCTLLFKPLSAGRGDKNDAVVLAFSDYSSALGNATVVTY